MAEGRDAKGRFVKGCKGIAGRRRKKPEDKYLRVFSSTVRVEDFREILLSMIARARAGDASAARLILEHGLGKPPQRVDVTSGGERLPNVIVYLPEIDELETEPGTAGEVSS